MPALHSCTLWQVSLHLLSLHDCYLPLSSLHGAHQATTSSAPQSHSLPIQPPTHTQLRGLQEKQPLLIQIRHQSEARPEQAQAGLEKGLVIYVLVIASEGWFVLTGGGNY